MPARHVLILIGAAVATLSVIAVVTVRVSRPAQSGVQAEFAAMRQGGITSAGPLPPCTAIADWATAAEGARMQAGRAEAYAKRAKETRGQELIDAHNWVYASLPINVDADRSYTFDFGPLDPNFTWPYYPFGPSGPEGVFGIYLPPGFTGRLVPNGGDSTPVIVTINGKRYLEVKRSLSNVTPCSQLVAWIT